MNYYKLLYQYQLVTNMITKHFGEGDEVGQIGNKSSIKSLLKSISYSPFTSVFCFLFEILGTQSLSEGMLNGNFK